jgi:hypothetical protein
MPVVGVDDGGAGGDVVVVADVPLRHVDEVMVAEGIVTLNSRVQHGAEGSPGTGHASRWAHVSWRQISKASDRIARWAWATR